ncbi:MAG: ATP-binding protein [Sutterella sp.]|nr:ATP-binding protein [Sutterella sp.]
MPSKAFKVDTVHEQVIKHLEELKLQGMASQYRSQVLDPKFNEMSFGDRMLCMLEEQIAGRNARRRERLKKASGVVSTASFDDLIRDGREAHLGTLKEISGGFWMTWDVPINLMISGATGTGKTWILEAMSNKASEMGLSSLLVMWPSFLDQMRAARRENRIESWLLTMQKKRLLSIDDFGMAPMEETELSDFFRLVTMRDGVHSTAIASQKGFETWHEYLGGGHIADAVIDRLINRSYKLDLKGESLRKEKSPTAKRGKPKAKVAEDA